MIQFLKRLARFGRCESGAPTVEFALVFPAFILILASTVELGAINLRQTALESRLDQAMRTVRINTGVQYTHNDIKAMICENAPMLGNCDADLRLEMIPNDPRSYTAMPPYVDCVDSRYDTGATQNIVRNFHLGNANELVVVRACLLYDPILPGSMMALSRARDENGKSAMVAVSAFTQEPR